MKELDKEAIAEQQEETYLSVCEYIISAQNKVKSAVNHAMVNAYWKIGEQIYAAKYLPYMPTEEELRRELNLEDFKKVDLD